MAELFNHVYDFDHRDPNQLQAHVIIHVYE